MNLIKSVYWFCMLLCVCHIRAENITIHHCCPSGQALLVRDKSVCWNPITNTTGPIDMFCKVYLRFPQFTFTEDSKLKVDFGYNNFGTFETFCIGNMTSNRDVSFKKASLRAVLCADETNERVEDKILGYCFIVSLLFLVPTAVVYSALPELRDVQGKSIINLCVSLAIGQGILAIMKIMKYKDMALCATRGFLGYFFVITSFFWTNAISIQVLLNTRRPITLDYSWHEFKYYFLYCWSIPIILTACMAIVNFHPGNHMKPGIGLNNCWFFNVQTQWHYMYSVMTILLIVNISIFVYVFLIICRLKVSSNHLKALRYKLMMSTRLIILMGLPWIFEMIGSFSDGHIIWTIIDVFNCLQGVLIFLLLVLFRRRVVKKMYERGWLNFISGVVERHLAFEDDDENVLQHTEVAMNDRDTS